MLNDIQAFNDAGHGAKCPKGAIAYKYETEQVQTIARTIASNNAAPVLNTILFLLFYIFRIVRSHIFLFTILYVV
jgi:hypothetical protein